MFAGRKVTIGSRLAAIVGMVATVATLAGCDVRLDATQVAIDLGPTGPQVVAVKNAPPGFADRKEIPAGETVITVVNLDQRSSHRLILVKTNVAFDALPARVRDAKFVSEDPDEILELSLPLERNRLVVSAQQFVNLEASLQWHEYLQAGQRYIIFDPDRLSARYYLYIQARSSP